MRKICFITGTRADYGIMSRLIKCVDAHPEATLQLIATNMHLSPEYGMTVNEIIADGIHVDERIESLLSADTPSATVKSMAIVEMGMADALSRLKPDLVVILGDRYEMLAAASAAMIFRIPIAHLYGGETTEGAYDDCIRHAITKLSTLHFASTALYASRIVQMGEDPERVFHAGSLGVENIHNENITTLQELEQSIGFSLGEKYIVATYHPVTSVPGEETLQTKALLNALGKWIDDGWKVLFTLPNSDTGGKTVAHIITDWAATHPENVKAVDSLGRRRYYSALSHASAVVGNSSSGLIEAPSFGIPTLDIGDRQKGRAAGESVVHCGPVENEIEKGLETALSPEMRIKAASSANPYEKEGTLSLILEALLHAPLPATKAFFTSGN